MYTATTVDEWTAILRLAVRWGFGTIRALSIQHLAPIATDIDKIVLGRQYGIDQWLHEAFIAVCAREQSLTKEEGRRLTVDDIIEINAVRQLVGSGAQSRQARSLSIAEACAGFDISQFVSPPIAIDLGVTNIVGGQSGQGPYPALNQPDIRQGTTDVDTTVILGSASLEDAEMAAALERADDMELTESRWELVS